MSNLEIKFSPVIAGAMRLGNWGAQLSSGEMETFIEQCIELGVTDFDHADIYGAYTTEEQFGDVLRLRKDLASKIQITTKCGIRYPAETRPENRIKSYDTSRDYITQSIDRSLKNLGVERIKLFLLHRPDFIQDQDDVVYAIERARSAGKIEYFGVSNYSTSQLDLILEYLPIATHQIEASLLHLDPFENGQLDQLQRLNITPTIWSPLGGGQLFGDTDDPRAKRIKEAAAPMLEEKQCSMDQLLLAWLLKHPSDMVPVLGTSKIQRVSAALEARHLELTREEWYTLWTASKGEKVP